ncbi:MAG: ferrous iron transport protein A [Firmicutes bacterium]|nr:ferrous iron transport protein A [Bacillota bacterium]
MPLNLADIGTEYIVKRISGKQEIKQHLENLGFVAGATVIVVSKVAGNVIVNVKESRIAINSEMAQKIYV